MVILRSRSLNFPWLKCIICFAARRWSCSTWSLGVELSVKQGKTRRASGLSVTKQPQIIAPWTSAVLHRNEMLAQVIGRQNAQRWVIISSYAIVACMQRQNECLLTSRSIFLQIAQSSRKTRVLSSKILAELC